MKEQGYIIILLLLAFIVPRICFADLMDGNPEVAPVAGEFIGSDPLQNLMCDVLKKRWKEQYHAILSLEKNHAFVPKNQKSTFDNTTNHLLALGCIQNTDKLKEEVMETMKY